MGFFCVSSSEKKKEKTLNGSGQRSVFVVKKLFFFFFFFVGLWSQSADKHTIHSIPWSWIFYKPTIPQSPPSHLRDYSTCNNARLEFTTIFVPSFDPNVWCLKNGLHSGGLNPGPLSHESSALTTRPRLLAKLLRNLFKRGRLKYFI